MLELEHNRPRISIIRRIVGREKFVPIRYIFWECQKRPQNVSVRKMKTDIPEIGDVSINVLVTNREGWWVAQGVEYDIVAQGKTIEDMEYEFERMLMVHILSAEEFGLVPLESLPPAPEEIRQAFKMARILQLEAPRIRAAAPRAEKRVPKLSARLYGGNDANHLTSCPA